MENLGTGYQGGSEFYLGSASRPSQSVLKEINPKRNQPRIFIGRTDAEAEAPILWLPDVKSPLIGKDPESGKD